MSISVTSLMMPLTEITELFQLVKKYKDQIVVNNVGEGDSFEKKKEVMQEFLRLIDKPYANDFYPPLCKHILSFNRSKTGYRQTVFKNKLIYNLTLALIIIVACITTIVIPSHIAKKGNRLLAVAILIILAIMTSFISTIAAAYFDKKKKVDSKLYSCDVNVPGLQELLNYSTADGFKNYVLHVFYQVFYNDDSIVYEDAPTCNKCDDNNCASVKEYLNGCVQNKDVVEAVHNLMVTINNVFKDIDKISLDVFKKDPFSQVQVIKTSIEYLQKFFFKVSQGEEAASLSPEELDTVIRKDILPIFNLSFIPMEGMIPIVEPGRNMTNVADNGVTHTQCIMKCMDNPDCGMCFVDADKKCTLYLKNSTANRRAKYKLKYNGDKDAYAVIKRNEQFADVSVTGCLSKNHMSTMKEQSLSTICTSQETNNCATHVVDAKNVRYYPKQDTFLEYRHMSFNKSCELSKDEYATFTTTTMNIIQEMSKGAVMTTLSDFQDVIAEQLFEIIKRHRGRFDIESNKEKLYVLLKNIYDDKYEAVLIYFEQVFKKALKKYDAYKATEFTELANSKAKHDYISYELFKAKLAKMPAREFMDVFCLHVYNLNLTSDGLATIYKLYDYDHDAKSADMELFKRFIVHAAILAALGIGYFANQQISRSQNMIGAWINISIAISVYMILLCYAVSWYKKRKSVLKFNKDVIDKNGNTIRVNARRICTEILVTQMAEPGKPRIGIIPCYLNTNVNKEQKDYCAKEGNLKCLQHEESCKGLTSDRILTIDEHNEDLLKKIYQNMVEVLDAIQQCNSVLLSANIRLPFPYLDITTNMIMVTICVISIYFVISRFGLLRRLSEVRYLYRIREKISNYVNVPASELDFYLNKTSAISPDIQNFLILLFTVVFVGFSTFYSSALVSSSENFANGLYNSPFFYDKKCYK